MTQIQPLLSDVLFFSPPQNWFYFRLFQCEIRISVILSGDADSSLGNPGVTRQMFRSAALSKTNL